MLNNPQAIYVQRGEVIDYTNAGQVAIKSNDVVGLATRIGVAATDIPIGAVGVVNIIGVFDLPALSTEAFTVGQAVYWKDDALTGTSSSAIAAGWVVEPKATAGTKARIKIG